MFQILGETITIFSKKNGLKLLIYQSITSPKHLNTSNK